MFLARSTQRSLQADTSGFSVDLKASLNGAGDVGNKFDMDTGIFQSVSNLSGTKRLKGFYLVSLWSCCEGEIEEGVETVTWFNPKTVWGSQNTVVQNVFRKNIQSGLHGYRSAV